MTTYQLILFFSAATVLLVIPGLAVMFIVSRSLEQSTKAGVVSVVGIALGGLVHLVFAVLGLTALLAASAQAFNVLRFAGAAYLLYLGATKLLSRNISGLTHGEPAKPVSLRQLFWQGLFVQILNPKIALFFLSFLPQFVDPARGQASVQVFTLGFVFICMGFLTDSLYAIIAGKLSDRITRNPGVIRFQRWFTGVTYLSLGAFAAFSGTGTRKP